MRILAFSDVHGYIPAVERLVSEVSKIKFEIIVFAGDFTNAWFDGPIRGQMQMDGVADLLSSLDRPIYFIYGNRDISVKCPIGNDIQEKDWKIGEYRLTSQLEALDSSTILVTHALQPMFQTTQTNAFLYLYGHDHVGRICKNYLDLGFLYRSSADHGARKSPLRISNVRSSVTKKVLSNPFSLNPNHAFLPKRLATK